MSERKQTPDVLADILDGPVPIPDMSTPLPIGRITDLPPRRPAAPSTQAKSEAGSMAAKAVANTDDLGIRDRLVPGRPRLAAAVRQRAGAARLDVWAADS